MNHTAVDDSELAFAEPWSISKGRRTAQGGTMPHYFLRLGDVPGHEPPGTAGVLEVHPDDSVTVRCACHEPVVEGDLILGLRAVPA